MWLKVMFLFVEMFTGQNRQTDRQIDRQIYRYRYIDIDIYAYIFMYNVSSVVNLQNKHRKEI